MSDFKDPKFLELPDKSLIAYHSYRPSSSKKSPGIVFMGGFKSDMEGTKALFLEKECKKREIPFLRFDYYGHGQSSGTFTDGTIGRWKSDSIEAISKLTKGPQLLVGSSMGGWLMLLAALELPERTAGIFGIASAPDFTENLLWEDFNEEIRNQIMEEGSYSYPSNYCSSNIDEEDPYIITRTLIEEGRNNLLMNEDIGINCPVHLLHGMKDEDVPYGISVNLAKLLNAKDVVVTLIKEGDHRMSSDTMLELLEKHIFSFYEKLAKTL